MDKLPPDFDGVFRFTNWTDEDFSARWDNVEYTFPAQKMTPMIIPTASPEQVQHIRKKFAKELAEREFYKSAKMEHLDKQNTVGALSSFRTAVTYSPSDLEPLVAKCLTSLPLGSAKVEAMPKDDRSFHTDDDGQPVTKIIDKSKSLVGDGAVIG